MTAIVAHKDPRRYFEAVGQERSATRELWPNLGDGGLREAAYRAGEGLPELPKEPIRHDEQ